MDFETCHFGVSDTISRGRAMAPRWCLVFGGGIVRGPGGSVWSQPYQKGRQFSENEEMPFMGLPWENSGFGALSEQVVKIKTLKIQNFKVRHVKYVMRVGGLCKGLDGLGVIACLLCPCLSQPDKATSCLEAEYFWLHREVRSSFETFHNFCFVFYFLRNLTPW